MAHSAALIDAGVAQQIRLWFFLFTILESKLSMTCSSDLSFLVLNILLTSKNVSLDLLSLVAPRLH